MNPIQKIADRFGGGQGGKRARKTLAIAFVALVAFSVVAPFLGGFAFVESDHSGTAVASDGATFNNTGETYSFSTTRNPNGVAADGDGYFYVDQGDNIDKVRGSDMSRVDRVALSDSVESVTYADGYVYVTDGTNYYVRQYYASNMTLKDTYTGHSNNVYQTVKGSDGYVYSVAHPGEIRKLDPSTMTAVDSFDSTYTMYAIAYDSSGYLYAGTLDNGVLKIDISTMSEADSFPTNTVQVKSVDYDGNGNLFAGLRDSTVRKVDVSTMSQTGNYTAPTTQMNQVTYSEDGYVYATNESLHRIHPGDMSQGDANHDQTWRSFAKRPDGTMYVGTSGSVYKFNSGTTVGYEVSGTVEDASGNALEGANVTLEQSGSLLNSTTTNASGGYEFTGVEDGDYTVSASADGYHDDAKEITVSGSSVTVDFNLSAIESGAAGKGQAIGLVKDGLGVFPPDDTDLVVHHRTSEYKPLWQASGDSPEDWKQYSWSEVETASFNWENRTWVGLTDGEYYRLELHSRHGTWEDSGFRYDKAEMLGSTVWLRPETGHLDSNDDGTAGGSSSSGTNGPGDGSDSTSDDDSTATEDDGFGPTALGSCTTTDGQDGVEVEYWDPGYETYELRANLSVDGSTTYFIHKSFDDARGYYRGCLADVMTNNASDSRDTVFEHNATGLDGAVVSSGSTSYEPPIFGPSGVAPASTVERIGLLAGVLGALGALWFGGNRYVPGTAVEAWPVDSVSPAFGVGAPLVAVLGLDLAGGGVISAGLATGLAQIAPFAGIVGVTIAGYYALRWIRAPPS